jgi:hypothetical protein
MRGLGILVPRITLASNNAARISAVATPESGKARLFSARLICMGKELYG